MEFHEIADRMPMMGDEEFSALVTSIKERGLLKPIEVYEGKIIDGRNRYRACRLLEIEPSYTKWNGNGINPWLYVWDSNAERRHLRKDVKVALWMRDFEPGSVEWAQKQGEIKERASLKLSEAAQGNVRASKNYSRQKLPAVVRGENVTRQARAEKTGVSEGTVKAVETAANKDPKALDRIIGEEASVWDILKEKKIEERKNYIASQREAIEKGTHSLPEGVFEVIVIDPPWNYDRDYDPKTSRVANPYPEMNQDELMAIQLPSAKDGVLFLWTTHRFIWDAKQLMDRWGYEHKGIIVWDKESMGMGSWLRMQCEFCLVGIRGKPLWDNKTWTDIIREKRREHSRKPESFYKMVEDITTGRRLDYFSREERKGWISYGCERDKF